MTGMNKQRGQMLIGAVLATALIGLALAGLFHWERRNQMNEQDNAAGSSLAQYGVGLRGFIAATQGGSTPMPSNPYSAQGVNWLKPPSCGGLSTNPVQGYVPCVFNGGFLGSTYQTTITKTPATNTIEARTSFFVPLEQEGPSARGVRAAGVALAALAQQTLPANGTFLTVLANAPLTADAPVATASITAADRGRVLLIANNSPSNDVFLRVDGTNKMLADLDMGGQSITAAKDGSFTGDIHAAGTVQIDNGLSVTSGTADLRGGVITTDVQVSSVGHMASQALYEMQVLSGQLAYTVPKPDCSNANIGSSSPAIYTAMQGTGSPAAGGGDALYDAHVEVVSDGNQWTITPVVRATTFNLTGTSDGTNLTINLNKAVAATPAKDQVILVMTKCR